MKKFLSLLLVFAILSVMGINAFAATVGQQLLSPEEGWSRYDDSESAITYVGSWISLNHNYYYNSTYRETLEIGSKVQFNFIGSKLRIFTTQDNVNHNAGKHTVYIDGVNCGTYEYLPNTSLVKCKLLYENTLLSYKEHFVEVVTEDYKNTTRGATWDCIDIDSTGALKPYDPSVNDTPVTPPSSIIEGNRAILVITMTNGNSKEYDMSAAEIEAFVNWFDDKENGVAGTKAYFAIKKNYNVKPFISRQDFIIFSKIQDFEIKDYNE